MHTKPHDTLSDLTLGALLCGAVAAIAFVWLTAIMAVA